MVDAPRDPDARGPNVVAFEKTRSAISQDPTSAAGNFVTVTEWQSGTNALTRARHLTVDTDEPESLGGRDQAPDPMELLLAAIGSCLTIGWVKHAKMRNLEVRSVKVVIEAPFDLRGYFDLDADVRPGFGSLTYKVLVDCDGDDALLAEITSAAERTSPLIDNVLNATPIQGRVYREASEAARKS